MTDRQLKYQTYLQSQHWADLRGKAITRDGSKCRRCPSTLNLEVHHTIYRDRFEDSLLEDLETLCHECHHKHHHPEPIKVINHERLEDFRQWIASGRTLSKPQRRALSWHSANGTPQDKKEVRMLFLMNKRISQNPSFKWEKRSKKILSAFRKSRESRRYRYQWSF